MKRNLKDSITNLRAEGNTLTEIKNKLSCSYSTISYYLYPKTKISTKNRTKRLRKSGDFYKKQYRKSVNSVLSAKITQFHRLGRSNKKKQLPITFTFNEVKDLAGENPTCYLTGDKIDLSNPSAYSLDHKVPISRNGTCTLDNLGLSTSEVNRCKNDRTVEEFLTLCKKVLEKHNYTVIKN